MNCVDYTFNIGGLTLSDRFYRYTTRGYLSYEYPGIDSSGEFSDHYSYDAWGKCTVENAEGSSEGAFNPFRYRGYYWDAESGLYYLNSRYYSPELCRFISADSIIDNRGVITQNLFAYCGNNPVNASDSSGHLFIGTVVGGIVGGIFGGLGALINGESVKAGIVTGAATGATVGYICDSVMTGGITAGIGVLAIGAVSAVGNFANQAWNNYDENREQSSKKSSSNKENSLQYIKKSIVEVNYAEVANSAIVGMTFAPMSYGTNKLLNTAFSNLDNSFTNRVGEFLASSFLEFNVAAFQFIVDLF